MRRVLHNLWKPTESKKASYALFLMSMVGAKTFSLLTDLLPPKRPSETPLNYILKALRDFHVPKKIVLGKRYSFQAQKQLNGESLAEYVATLKGLASTCEFSTSLEEYAVRIYKLDF